MMNLGLLALKARTSLFANILVDTWPHILTGHKTLRSTNTRV